MSANSFVTPLEYRLLGDYALLDITVDGGLIRRLREMAWMVTSALKGDTVLKVRSFVDFKIKTSSIIIEFDF